MRRRQRGDHPTLDRLLDIGGGRVVAESDAQIERYFNPVTEGRSRANIMKGERARLNAV